MFCLCLYYVLDALCAKSSSPLTRDVKISTDDDADAVVYSVSKDKRIGTGDAQTRLGILLVTY